MNHQNKNQKNVDYRASKSHYRPALITLLVALILLVGYFAAVRPIVNSGGEEPPAVTTAPGEGIHYSQGTLYPSLKRTDMVSIRVHNEKGTYEFRRVSLKESGELAVTDPFVMFQEEIVGKDENGDPKQAMVGYPEVAYNEERFSELVVATGTFYYLKNLTGDAVAEGAALDYSRYGLAPEDNPAWFEITTFSDANPIRVYVGNPAVTDSGYYVRVEGREAVYVSNSTLVGTTALENIESYVDPMLTSPLVSNGYYFNKDFTIWRQMGNEYVIDVQDTVGFLFDTYENGVLKHADEYATVDLIRAKDALRDAFVGKTVGEGNFSFTVTYPDDESEGEDVRGKTFEYRVKEIKSVNSLYITLNFVKTSERSKFHAGVAYAITAPESKLGYQPNTNNYMGVLEKIGYMSGTETVAVGLTSETIQEFGLGYYTIYFEAPTKLSYDTAAGKTDDVLIQETNKYYLYISEKQEDGSYFVGSEQTNTVARVDGELLSFLERSEAWWLKDTMYTVNINEATKLEFDFNYSDLSSKFDFVLTHKTVDSKSKTLSSVYFLGDNRPLNTEYFRSFYMHLLTCYYTGEYDGELPKEELIESGRSVLSMRVTLSDGEVYVYRYYPYSARHVLVSIAKEGESEGAYFYILSAEVEKIYRDIQTLLAGGEPDPEKQY